MGFGVVGNVSGWTEVGVEVGIETETAIAIDGEIEVGSGGVVAWIGGADAVVKDVRYVLASALLAGAAANATVFAANGVVADAVAANSATPHSPPPSAKTLASHSAELGQTPIQSCPSGLETQRAYCSRLSKARTTHPHRVLARPCSDRGPSAAEEAEGGR